MSIKGKTAVITGSTSGIGLGIAQGFAAQGVNIVMNGFGDPEAIEKERLALEALGCQAIYNPADMTKPEQIEGLIDAAAERFGSVDILVNNAGIQHVAPIDEFPIEKWNAIIAINMSSSFHTTRATLKHMKQQGWGHNCTPT